MGFFSRTKNFFKDKRYTIKEKVRDVARKIKYFFTGDVDETSRRTEEEDLYDEVAATLAETK